MTARPAAAVLFAALPMLAVHAQSPLQGLPETNLPGLDQVRVAIPEGALGEHSLAVYEVRSVLPPRMVLSEVERHWRKQGADVVLQARSGDWFVLSQRLDEAGNAGNERAAAGDVGQADVLSSGFETLQLRARHGGGSTGLLTRWFRPDTPDATSGHEQGTGTGRGSDVSDGLLPAEARQLRRFTSNEPDGRRGMTLVAHLDDVLDGAEARVDGHLLRLGFLPVRSGDDRHALRWRDDRARFYRDAARELMVTLHQEPDGVGVVLHLMEKAP